MASSFGKKSGTTGKAKGWMAGPKAYRIKDVAAFAKGVTLPKRSHVFIVPQTEAADAELRQHRGVRRMRPSVGLGMSAEPKRTVSAEAYEPDARARAVLRGIAHAEEDLKAAGGTYEVDDVRALLRGVSRQAVDKKVADGSLLAVLGPNGRRRFPTAQFADDGSPIKGLREVSAALGYSSRWAVLNFLVNAHDLLGEERPIDALRRGDVDRVVEAAERSGVHAA